jgi:hypothetical protein
MDIDEFIKNRNAYPPEELERLVGNTLPGVPMVRRSWLAMKIP